MSRIRSSFAAKLLVVGLVLALVVIGGVSGFLVLTREGQTRQAALSNADNRAKVTQEVLGSFVLQQSQSAAYSLSQSANVSSALLLASGNVAVANRFLTGELQQTPPLRSRAVVILNQAGTVVFAQESDQVTAAKVLIPSAGANLVGSVASVQGALGGKTSFGLENFGATREDSFLAYDDAYPVFDVTNSRVIGAVVEVGPLALQLADVKTAIGYPAAFIAQDLQGFITRFRNGQQVTQAGPSELSGQLHGTQPIHAIYTAPLEAGGVGLVAGSFVSLDGPAGTTAGYVGVEIPLSAFALDQTADERTVALLAFGVLCLTAIVIVLFVEQGVRRPVARLERGVARIAGGDWTTDIDVRSTDELGRLAQGVNVMRREIAKYVSEIQSARTRLDAAVEQLGSVSRALTTTTAGVPALQTAVVNAAANLGGTGASAMLLLREGEAVNVRASTNGASPQSITDVATVRRLLSGTAVRMDQSPHGWQAGELLAAPMFYQERVVGALALVSAHGARLPEGIEPPLAVLANNAAVALENTRLFELERETVRRLRELDRMKTEFLGTVQHELRTPLTAILGLGELLDQCWTLWGDELKLDTIRDIQTAAGNLHDIVETIIDFSLLEQDTLVLNPTEVAVRPVVEAAVAAVESRLKGGLPVEVKVHGDDATMVFADPMRFEQVMRELIHNAVKFTPPGGHVQVTFSKNGPNETWIEVADDGIGIAEENLGKICDRFFQVDNSATRRFSGTGMGLALVKRLVEAHGAEMVVRSSLGHGSRFCLRWPAMRPEAPGGSATGGNGWSPPA